MIKRIGLTVGSIGAAGVLAFGLAASGFGPASRPDPAADTTVATDTFDGIQPPGSEPAVETEVVYVRPAPEPEIVRVTEREAAPRRVDRERRWRDDDDDHDRDDHDDDHDDDRDGDRDDD